MKKEEVIKVAEESGFVGGDNRVTVNGQTFQCGFWEYPKRNSKDEKLVIGITFCCGNGKNSLPYLWYQNGYTSHLLSEYWSVDTYVYNTDGDCYRAYNPQEKFNSSRTQMILDFNWMLEATADNLKKLLDEIVRRFLSEF